MRDYTNTTATVNFLSDEEQRDLIAAAQDVPCTIETDADGAEVVRFGKTRESEAALTTLIKAFSPLLKSVARTSKVLDFEEAEAVCYERFIQAVREFDPSVTRSFSASVRERLRRELSDVDRTSDIVSVKENAAARYWRLIHKYEGNVAAAYEECRTTANAFEPSTFLAIHHAMCHTESLDMNSLNREVSSAPKDHEANLIDRTITFDEDIALADLVRWAFTKVDDREEQILRLRYGFYDLATENIRLRAGFRNDHDDMVMSDREVAQALGSTTPTVSRLKRQALDTMRAAMDSLAQDGAE